MISHSSGDCGSGKGPLPDGYVNGRWTTATCLVSVRSGKSSLQRTFQAIRILVNDELTALDAFLRDLPFCLAPGGRAAILTFHSGEDRLVKKAFRAGLEGGLYARVADEVVRATPEERGRNPRSSSAKLRWAVRAGPGLT